MVSFRPCSLFVPLFSLTPFGAPPLASLILSLSIRIASPFFPSILFPLYRDKGERDQTVENKARIAAMQIRMDDFEERLAGVEAAPTNGVVETQYNIRM